MKFIDRIIADIPLYDIEKEESKYHDEYKYAVDTKILLDNLREYEIEIPTEYFEKYEQVFGNGVLQYMEKLTNTEIKDFKGGNTYNYNGKIIHDLDYWYADTNNKEFYIAIKVHRLGDVRCNYTEFALFKFDSFESFFETIDEICNDKFYGCMEYNNKHYYYDISIFSEYLSVWCEETKEYFEIYAYNDESFIEEIKKNEKS